MKIVKPSLKVLGLHIVVVLVSFILSIPFWMIAKYPEIYSGITTLVYIIVMYSAGWNIGRKDSRRVREYQPNVKKIILTGLISCIIPLIILALRVASPFIHPNVWAPLGAGHELILTESVQTKVYDLVYRFWFFYFTGFMGSGDFVRYVIPIFILPVLLPVSYLVGLTGFSFFAKVYNKILYKE